MKNLIFSSLALFILTMAPAPAPLGAMAPTSPQAIPLISVHGPEAAHPSTTDEPLIVRSKVVEGGLEVLIANLEQSKTYVTLTNLDTKRTMYTDRIHNHNGYSYNLNLEKLKSGRYLLAVTKGKEVRQQVLLISKTGVLCSAWK